MDKIGVATVSGSPWSNRYEFKAGPRLENNAMATEEVGVVSGSSNEAESSVSERVSEKFNPFPVAVDGCFVLIKKFSCSEVSAELSHVMLRAVTGSCSSVVRNSCGPNPASSTTSTQPCEGYGLNKLSDILTSFCKCMQIQNKVICCCILDK